MAKRDATTAFGDHNHGFQARIINGPVHTEFHLPPNPAEVRRQPCISIPFSRDKDFIDRGTLLEEIKQRLSAPASRLAIVGIGGVGKSQLAIEYCYRTRERAPDTWIFWIHASSTARIEQGLRDITDVVSLTDRTGSHTDTAKLLLNWLRDARNGKWLIVVDNADDTKVLSRSIHGDRLDSHRASLQHFLRQLSSIEHGSILITSRSRHAVLQLVQDHDIVGIERMETSMATALLSKKLKNAHDDDKRIAELADMLDGMPLALVQAAAFIKKRASWSVARYLDELRRSDRRATKLLSEEAGLLQRDIEAENCILKAWQISFDHIRNIRRSAADLLALMSFFDRQGIPEKVLRNQPTSIEDQFDCDVVLLTQYALITITGDDGVFEMHRLVQLATRKWLEAHGEFAKTRDQYIANVCAHFPSWKAKDWAVCEALYPHMKNTLAHRPSNSESLKQWALLLDSASWYALDYGRVDDALHISKLSKEVNEELYGRGHAETIHSVVQLARLRSAQGRHHEAQNLYTTIVNASMFCFGETSRETEMYMYELGKAYRNNGNSKEAGEQYSRVLSIQKSIYGEAHPLTLKSMHNLACSLSQQGYEKKSIVMLRDCLSKRKEVLGEKHRDTLATMYQLARNLREQGQLSESSTLMGHCFELYKEVCGKSHERTLASMYCFAECLYEQGRYEEARVIADRCVGLYKASLGEKSRNTLVSMDLFGQILGRLGHHDDATRILRECLRLFKDAFGKTHVDTLEGMHNLAYALNDQGRRVEAIALMRECVETKRKVLGTQHTLTSDSLEVLRKWVQEDRSKEEQAEEEVQLPEGADS
ncbi:P-loop containing nucleoside triphosphate hydrolase protein [Lophiotrema nucula]|uniref:P-loop containing nucleoside triphosphate hydrolase protein n=1 Tax=Lophiotrema nucula TaxID=690887 RepID=A0A6A5YZ96_9PLEO|nr:P-loop containing nucleoside triphosphate hydrolase protein [Lophiotrema nucula]